MFYLSDVAPMVAIPAGRFVMGSDLSPNESPVREVFLEGFRMDVFPVTNAEFRKFVEAGGYHNRQFWSEAGWAFAQERKLRQPLYFDDEYWNAPDQPVTGVSWWEAKAYARFVNKKLPTEAQWEYAARGVDGRLYPWGNEPPTSTRATFAAGCEPDDLHRHSTSVHATCQGISPFGVRDMAGNLFEWCLDNASLHYGWDITCRDPLYWTDECDDHVARGGSGLHNEDYLRCSARDYYPPQLRDNIVGIRLVDQNVGNNRDE